MDKKIEVGKKRAVKGSLTRTDPYRRSRVEIYTR